MDRLKIPATARVSLALYNSKAEIDALAAALTRIISLEAGKAARPPAPANAHYPPPAAASPDAAAEQLIEAFDLLGDWNERYQYLVELGGKLPPMPAAMKTEANRVHGCMSVVHFAARKRPGTADTIDFLADSDAVIVRGLIAVLQRIFSGQSAAAILTFDIQSLLKQLGLDQNLIMGRRIGLAAMIQRIRADATTLAT